MSDDSVLTPCVPDRHVDYSTIVCIMLASVATVFILYTVI